MHYRTLKILTSLFMAIVIVVVLVAARSTLWPSEETDVTTTPEQTTQGLATEPPDPTESAAPTTVADPVPLPVAIGQATTEPGQSRAAGRRIYPSPCCVNRICHSMPAERKQRSRSKGLPSSLIPVMAGRTEGPNIRSRSCIRMWRRRTLCSVSV